MAVTGITEYLGPGQDDLIPYANAGSAIAAGDLVVLASGTTGYVGVAKGDIAATTGTGTVQTRGLVTVAKATGEAFTVGQPLYTNGTALTGASTGNTYAGRAALIAASAATTCVLILNA